MKILIVSSRVSKTPHGISYSFVFDEIRRLAKKGLEVHVVRSSIEDYKYSYNIHFHGLERGFQTITLFSYVRNVVLTLPPGLLQNPKTMYLQGKYYGKVAEVAENFKIDIIHAHFAFPEGVVGYLVARKVGKPLLITVHGYDVLTEPSVGYGIRLRKRYDFLVRKVLTSASAVICNSTALYKEVRRVVKDKSRVYLIFNGVDLTRFNPDLNLFKARHELNLPLDRFIVFTVRHHEPKYGIEYLIRAIPYVVKQNKDVLFIIGGDGSLRKYHEKLARKFDVARYTVFTGIIPQRILHLYYVASDVIVVPSLQEAWGLVVTEALASGKPVIGSDVGGIKDQIIEDFNGFLVPPRDPLAIAEKILYFIDNPSEMHRMGMNGRRLAEERFDIEKRIDRVINVYKNILSGMKDK